MRNLANLLYDKYGNIIKNNAINLVQSLLFQPKTTTTDFAYTCFVLLSLSDFEHKKSLLMVCTKCHIQDNNQLAKYSSLSLRLKTLILRRERPAVTKSPMALFFERNGEDELDSGRFDFVNLAPPEPLPAQCGLNWKPVECLPTYSSFFLIGSESKA